MPGYFMTIYTKWERDNRRLTPAEVAKAREADPTLPEDGLSPDSIAQHQSTRDVRHGYGSEALKSAPPDGPGAWYAHRYLHPHDPEDEGEALHEEVARLAVGYGVQDMIMAPILHAFDEAGQHAGTVKIDQARIDKHHAEYKLDQIQAATKRAQRESGAIDEAQELQDKEFEALVKKRDAMLARKAEMAARKAEVAALQAELGEEPKA